MVKALQRRGALNPDCAPVPFERYLDELAQYKVILSLPGMAQVCHRDVEGFGVGACVLRPRIEQEFQDPLKADVHYISVDTDIERDPPQVAAARIEERHRWVLAQPDLLAFVARNGAEWYDRNVSVPRSLDLTARLLDLAD